MQRWKTGLLAGIGIVSLSTAAQINNPGWAQAAPAWRTDFAAATAEARSTGKPLLVAFR